MGETANQQLTEMTEVADGDAYDEESVGRYEAVILKRKAKQAQLVRALELLMASRVEPPAEGELPIPYDWRDDAVCAQVGLDPFFPEKGGSNEEAKEICRTCEPREKCIEYALSHNEKFGIWGGLNERERAKIRRERKAAAKALEKAAKAEAKKTPKATDKAA